MVRFSLRQLSFYFALVVQIIAVFPPRLPAQTKPAPPAAPAVNPAVLNLTVDQVIENFIAARGGAEKLRAIQSERLAGRISFGPDSSNPFLVE